MYIKISNVIYFYLEKKEEDEPFPLMIQGNTTGVQCSTLARSRFHSVAFGVCLLTSFSLVISLIM